MQSKIQKNKNGFTIIEIMIVLAIAGLIMLIVFLAVPALERSARNTQRKNDVSAIASAIANYIDNNGGQLPAGTAVGSSSTTVKICGSANCATSGSGDNNYETATLGIYAASNVSLTTTPPTNPISINNVVILTGYQCNSTETSYGAASARTAAVLYAVESSANTSSQQCLQQ